MHTGYALPPFQLGHFLHDLRFAGVGLDDEL
jgi:hypothetical protein